MSRQIKQFELIQGLIEEYPDKAIPCLTRKLSDTKTALMTTGFQTTPWTITRKMSNKGVLHNKFTVTKNGDLSASQYESADGNFYEFVFDSADDAVFYAAMYTVIPKEAHEQASEEADKRLAEVKR